MHEFGIAESILAAALDAAHANRAQRVVAVRVRIGGLSGVVEEALAFAFDALKENTPAQGARLDVEPEPVRCYCASCSAEFVAAPLQYRCPTCGALSDDIRGGRELNLVSIEVT